MTDDRISISHLKVPTHIGATDDERATAQTVIVSLELTVDLAAASKSDDLDDTVDYDALTRQVADLVRGSNVRLLETLAGNIASRVCSFTAVERVTVEVMKESPPVPEDVGPIAVRITRP